MRQAIDDPRARRLEPVVVPRALRLDRVQAHKRTLFELDDALAIGRTSLCVDDQGVVVSTFLAQLLSIYYQLLDSTLALLRFSVDEHALHCSGNATHEQDVADFFCCDETRHLDHAVKSRI